MNLFKIIFGIFFGIIGTLIGIVGAIFGLFTGVLGVIGLMVAGLVLFVLVAPLALLFGLIF